MARLPTVYGDNHTWGNILNEWLQVAHNADGTIKDAQFTVAAGATGISSYTIGDMLYASATTTLSKLAIGAAETILTSSGTLPQWSTTLKHIKVSTDTNSGAVSYQAGEFDLNIGAAFGSSTATDTIYGAGIMGNVLGANLTKTRNIIAGVVGKYDITGTNAAILGRAAVVGEVGDLASSCMAAFLAILGGDRGALTPDAAFSVLSLNSTSASKFSFGLDLYRAAVGSYQAVSYGTASIRTPNASWIVGRNAADSANVNLARITSGNAVQLGLWTFPTSDSAGVFTSDGSGTVTLSAAVPSGGIIMIASGACPSGYTEYTGTRGRFVVGVPASGTLAGTAGSAMTNLQNPSVTPTFTGSALAGHTHTFTGSALSTHQHESPISASSATVLGSNFVYGTAGTTTFTAYTVVSASDTSMSKQLVSATSGGTPAGTLDSVSGGTPAGTVSAVASNSLAPYIQLMFCEKS